MAADVLTKPVPRNELIFYIQEMGWTTSVIKSNAVQKYYVSEGVLKCKRKFL